MGGFSIWHWLVLLLVVAVPVVSVALLVWIVGQATRSSARATNVSARTDLPGRPSIEARLRELAELKSKGLISDPEYDHQRAVILRDV